MFHLLLAIIYLSFISLGLPDAVLGAAWPTIYPQLHVPVSYAGIISAIVSVGTVVSSLLCDRIMKKLGTGKLTALSVLMTAIALSGFSCSRSFPTLCLWAIPYGLGAGSVDAALNNYVAIHYKSHHMSWLHCFWGIGATLGPYIMGLTLTAGKAWTQGYRAISLLQFILTVLLFASLPLWKAQHSNAADTVEPSRQPLHFRELLQIPGVRECMIFFFCYCAIEQTAGLWAGTYLTLHVGIHAETAASFAAMYFLGITIGRGISGFLTMKLGDTGMIRLGMVVIVSGILLLFFPGRTTAVCGLMLIGLGCAPLYPSMIHSTPAHFGADKSQAIIGLQMASAYCGTCLLPPLFGVLANAFSVSLLPYFSLIILILMLLTHKKLIDRTEK